MVALMLIYFTLFKEAIQHEKTERVIEVFDLTSLPLSADSLDEFQARKKANLPETSWKLKP